MGSKSICCSREQLSSCQTPFPLPEGAFLPTALQGTRPGAAPSLAR